MRDAGPLPLGLISLAWSYLVCSHFEQQGLLGGQGRCYRWAVEEEARMRGPLVSLTSLPGFIIPSIPADLHTSFIGTKAGLLEDRPRRPPSHHELKD